MKLYDQDFDVTSIAKLEVSHGNNSPTTVKVFLSNNSEQEISVFLESEKKTFMEEFRALSTAVSQYQQQIRDSQKAL